MSDVTHLLVHLVTIERNQRVQVAGGRYKETLAPYLSGIPFRISGLSSADIVAAQRMEVRATHNGYGEPDLDIKPEDFVVREDTLERYRVVGKIPPSLPHHSKVLLEQVFEGA